MAAIDLNTEVSPYGQHGPRKVSTHLLRGFLLFLIPTMALAASPVGNRKPIPPELSLCDLARKSTAYEGKTVRVHATAVNTFEEIVLFDPACTTVRSAVRFVHYHGLDDGPTTFDRMIEKCQAADAVFEGVFHGSEVLLDKHAAYRLLPPGTGYGYLRSYPMLIEVVAVRKVRGATLPGSKECEEP